MNLMQESDMPVTTQVSQAVTKADASFILLNSKFNEFTGNSLKSLNDQLVQAGIGKISL
jgi:hypothetical protein